VYFTYEDLRKELPNNIFRKANENLGKAVEYLLSTGNLQSASGLDLQQQLVSLSWPRNLTSCVSSVISAWSIEVPSLPSSRQQLYESCFLSLGDSCAPSIHLMAPLVVS
jgi:hypothetical protein